MRAVYASQPLPDAPLDALVVGERPEPQPADGWATVQVKAASLNHHDLWTLKGVGLAADRYPMILGCDAAGVDVETGAEVVVHAVISTPGWAGDETMDPGRTLLSEKHPGTIADYVCVPRANIMPKPAALSFEQAACLPTAWLTAYRMLFTRAACKPGETVLVQGASGGVASACIALGRAAGLRVWATARDETKQKLAIELGADAAFASGARLPDRVDAVMETVGQATWAHSLKSLRPGGRIVVSGATSGPTPPADLNRVFFLQLSVIGSTMGTRSELVALMAFLQTSGLRPHIDRVLPVERAAEGFEAMEQGQQFGKIVFTF